MMKKSIKIGLGGGCHWCTEAVFQSLKGVINVDQGYIASTGEAASFSEAVVVEFDPEIISLKTLLEIHLHTHNSTSNHSFRKKYRSAIYFMAPEEEKEAKVALLELQKEFSGEIITKILEFSDFKASRGSIRDYYRKNPDAPFCQRYIEPKLQLLQQKFQKEHRK